MGDHGMELDGHGLIETGAQKTLSVVIDAANVCWQLVTSQPGLTEVKSEAGLRPPVTGLALAVEFWRKYGVEPVAICPTWWLRVKEQRKWGSPEWEIQDYNVMEQMRQSGLLYCAPSGEHDDLYLLDYAFRTDGFLVSNDKYRDHQQNRDLDFNWIEERRIGFMFVRNTFIPNPDGIKRLELFCSMNNVVGSNQPVSLLPQPFLSQQLPATAPAAPASPLHPTLLEPIQYTSPSPSLPSSIPMQDSSQYQPPLSSQVNDRVIQRTIQVPDDCVGHIIGRQGTKIRQVSLDSGAKIQVERSNLSSSPTRTVVMMGTKEQVDKAESLINEIVQGVDGRDGVKIAKRDPVGMTPAPAITLNKRDDERRQSMEMQDDEDYL